MVQVSLLHRPTGIRVTCQETRSLQENRRMARKLLLKKVPHLTPFEISPLRAFQAGCNPKSGFIKRRAEGRQGTRAETAARQKGTEETTTKASVSGRRGRELIKLVGRYQGVVSNAKGASYCGTYKQIGVEHDKCERKP